MKITADKQMGLLYWGGGPLPYGADLIGTVNRQPGETGALIRLRTGRYIQGNAGSIRTLDRRKVLAALEEIRHEHQGAREG